MFAHILVLTLGLTMAGGLMLAGPALAAGEANHAAVDRGVRFLLDRQQPGGLWSEPYYTGTGFPRVFYLRYHGYPRYFPLWALARYRNLRGAGA